MGYELVCLSIQLFWVHLWLLWMSVCLSVNRGAMTISPQCRGQIRIMLDKNFYKIYIFGIRSVKLYVQTMTSLCIDIFCVFSKNTLSKLDLFTGKIFRIIISFSGPQHLYYSLFLHLLGLVRIWDNCVLPKVGTFCLKPLVKTNNQIKIKNFLKQLLNAFINFHKKIIRSYPF